MANSSFISLVPLAKQQSLSQACHLRCWISGKHERCTVYVHAEGDEWGHDQQQLKHPRKTAMHLDSCFATDYLRMR